MIFGKTKLELKVGIFVFMAFIILVIFVLSIGGFKTWSLGYRVNYIFNFANGVKVGAPVRFAGVDVGAVKDIKLYFDKQEDKTKINIQCWVRQDVKIPIDSTIWVETLGLLGEKYIEIMPGKDYAKVLSANQHLVGQDPIPLHEITELTKRIADNMDEGLIKIKNKEGTLGKLIYDDQIYNELEGLLSDSRKGLDTIFKETEGMVQDIRRNPWKLLYKPKGKPGKDCSKP